jgi:heptosyltransferase-2
MSGYIPHNEVKFLVIRFSSIGDIVLTTPVVRALKQQVDGARVHYLTKKPYAGVVQDNPYIDKTHVLDHNFNELARELKREGFDYIIDLHKNLRTALIRYRLRRMSFSFDKLNLKKWLLVNFKINTLPDIHIVDRYFEAVRLFDVKNDGQGLDFFIHDRERLSPEILPATHRDGFIGVVCGARHFTKKAPAGKLIDICKELNYPVVLLGGKGDRPEAGEIAGALGPLAWNACGEYKLSGSASLLSMAKAVLTNDTGLMHIAAALKKPTVSLWGNTVPEFGMYPYLPEGNYRTVEVKGLKCRPCSKIGYGRCPKKHFRCMEDIPAARVAGMLRAFLGEG